MVSEREEFWSHQYVRIAGGVAVGLLMFLLLFGEPLVTAVNDATRADLSKHVSNKSCGLEKGRCPGALECINGRYSSNQSGFLEDRVGVNISGARCVTPLYKERACGLFEWTIHSESWPGYRGTCTSYTDLQKFGPSDYLTRLLEEDNLYDRIFNTDRNGTKMIRNHGLTLAKENR
jgi:hypothetical protein